MINREIKIFSSIEELNNYARDEIARIANEAITTRGIFTVALSGGSTPKKLYEMLAAEDFQTRINWHQTHFFFGDERFVSPDSEESNFRMANEALFSKINAPPQNIHRFLTERDEAEIVAEKMENSMREFFGLAADEFPRFDLILLGMGADGHTASLFPFTSSLNEKERLVTENYIEKLQTFRLTFTIPTINHARNIIFLVVGADKAEALRTVLGGEYNPKRIPAQLIRPEKGNLTFFVDEKAAFLLGRIS
jgi:6-phosphogluconolactonase